MLNFNTPLELKSPDGAGTFAGHGAVFRSVDLGGDAIQPGAFADTLRKIKARGAPLPVLWSHDQSKPVGRFTALREDAKGLYVEGRLTMETQAAKDAFAYLRDRAVSGLSIGYGIPEGGAEHKNGVRLLHKIDLHEISLVAVPMHPDARISSVKMLDCADPRELKNYLRDQHQFSRSKAAAAAEALWRILRGEDTETSADRLTDALATFNQSFKGD
jgi:HK97 family phage prohead protease